MKRLAPPAEWVEPVRLIAGGGSASERRLLEAASRDVMPPGTTERLDQALSDWAALPDARASGLAAVRSGPQLVRWGIIGGLGALAIVSGMLAHDGQPSAHDVSAPTSAAPVAAAPAPMTERLPPAATAHGLALAVQTPPSPSTKGESRHAPQPRPSTSSVDTGRPERARTNGARSPGNLLEEARRLDAVRAALGAGDGPAASRELAEYRARFARGELRLEADVLETDLLLLGGEPERARLLATSLLARPDAGRYRQRLERLLQRTQPQRSSQQHTSEAAGSNRASAHMDERR
jgi:hypothetical protein